MRNLRAIIAACAALVLFLGASSPAPAQLPSYRFPVPNAGKYVSAESLGIRPESEDNDYAQTYQPSISKAKATASVINHALQVNAGLTFNTPGTYYIGSPISIQASNRVLMATVPGVVLKMHTSMQDYLLLIGTQTSFTTGGRNLGTPTFDSGTVSNVYVRGIEFQRSGNSPGAYGPGPGYTLGWPGHTCWVSNFRNVHFDDCAFTSYDSSGRVISGKYAILPNNGIGFYARNIRFQNHSDGIHPQGPIANVVLENLSGFTGDNMVGITQGDYAQYETTYGNIRNVTIDGVSLDVPRKPDGTATTWWNGASFVTPPGSVQPFRIDGHDGHWTTGTTYATDGYEVSDIVARNMQGALNTANSGIGFVNGAWWSGTAVAAIVKRVHLSGITLTNTASTGVVVISTNKLNDLTIDGLYMNTTAAAYAVYITATNAAMSIDARHVENRAAVSGAHLFQLKAAVPFLRVDDSTLISTGAGAVRFINAGANGVTITRLEGSNLWMNCTAGNGATSRFIHTADGNSTTYLASGELSNVHLYDVGFLLDSGNDAQGATRSGLLVTNLVEDWSSGTGNEHVAGRADVIIHGVNRNFKGKWVDKSYRTGDPSLIVAPQWTSITLDESDFPVAATSNVDMSSIARYATKIGQSFIPRGGTVLMVKAKHSTAFSGGSVTVASLSLGITSDYTQFASSLIDCCTAVTGLNFASAAPTHPTNASVNQDADQDIGVRLTFTGGTNPTAGKVQIWFLWSVTQ